MCYSMISIQLRKILEEKNITQAELSRATHIRALTISDLCTNNAAFVKIDNLSKICEYLDCDVNDLLKR